MSSLHTHTHNQNTTYQGLVIGVSAHACGECVCVMSECVVYVHVSKVHGDYLGKP